MRLKKAQLTGIKNKGYREVELGPVTYIQGSNRSGKSAISQAIQFAVFGKSDEVGAKSAGDLVANGDRSARVIIESTAHLFHGSIEINSKGSVSAKRQCSPSGSSLQVSEADVAEMLGPVPPTVSQLLQLTGEELWQLAMPDQMQDIPEYVIKLIMTAISQVSDLKKTTSGITTALGALNKLIKSDSPQSGHLATEYSSALGDLKRELSALAKSCLESSETKNLKPYNGEPVADLKSQIEAIDAQVKNLTNDMTLGNSNKELLAQKERDVERHRSSIERDEKALAVYQNGVLELTKAQAQVAAFGESCKEVFFGDNSSVDVTVDSLFTHNFRVWIQAHLKAHPGSELELSLSKLMSEMKALISESIYVQGDDPILDQMIANVKQAFPVNSVSAMNILDPNWRKTTLADCESQLVELYDKEKTLQSAIAKARLVLEKVEKERDEAASKASIVVDTEKLTELRNRRKAASDKIAEAEGYKTALDNAVACRAAAAQVEATYPAVDQAVNHLQQFRKASLEAGLDKIQQEANLIITACGLSPLVLEPSSGKRPALIIKNELGTKFSVMSGAERLIVGSSFIRAVQSVRNVVLPLLFIEGGELDGDMVCLLVKALVDFDPGGNVVISHWFLGDLGISPEIVKVHHA